MKKLLAIILTGVLLSGNAWAALSIDGSSVGNGSPISLTTAGTNDIIFLYLPYTSVTTGSVSDTSSLTWTKRATYTYMGQNIDEWYAKSATALSGDSISFSGYTLATFGVRPVAFGVNGANYTSPFDSNVSVPAASGIISPTTPCAVTGISTNNANDMLLAANLSGAAGVVNATGFTAINGNSIYRVSYNIVSSTQSSISVSTVTTTTSGAFVCGVDAVQQAGVSAAGNAMMGLF